METPLVKKQFSHAVILLCVKSLFNKHFSAFRPRNKTSLLSLMLLIGQRDLFQQMIKLTLTLTLEQSFTGRKAWCPQCFCPIRQLSNGVTRLWFVIIY